MSKKAVTESIIKEYARIRYLDGVEPKKIMQEVNAMYERNYNLKMFERWKVLGEWDSEKSKKQELIKKDEEVLKKLPTLEVATSNQYERLLQENKRAKKLLDTLYETIQEKKEEGKEFNIELDRYTKLRNSYREDILAEHKLVSQVVVGNKGSDISTIVMNFNNYLEKKDEKEIIDVFNEQ